MQYLRLSLYFLENSQYAFPIMRTVTIKSNAKKLTLSCIGKKAAYFILVLLAAAFLPINLSAQQSIASDEPIHIEADRMESNQKENSVTFSGNVQAIQGKLTINSDTMIIHYASQANDTASQDAKKQQIKKIFASGHVEIIQDELVATGNEVEFLADKKQILLTGNTKVWQNNNLVTGDKVLLDLATETTIVEPDEKSGGRVKAFFYPDSSKK
ncbi:MAG: lipopolysaccharide transport periplasmic protein LptA [Desulfovibrionaceae bacterium]|jgi:lipopolysaccharide export system protein LptA|nr:lipopolysaccharide transport periplasmic protein LptA [Desulfovibrionaceae bacterium]